MLKDIITPLSGLFSDGVQTVVRGHENRNRKVILLKGNLVMNQRSESRGISARVTKNGHYGFSSVAAYTAQDAERVLRSATENALFLDAKSAQPRPSYPALSAGSIPAFRPVVDIGQKRFIDACRQIDEYISAKYPDLMSRAVIYTEDSQEKIIVSSDAASGHVTYPRCYIYVVLTAEGRDGAPVELYKVFGGAGCFDDHFSDLTALYPGIDEFYEHLMKKKEGVYADAGEKTVILGGMMTGMLSHEAVGHTVEADLVIGGSVAGPCLNKRVASDKVSLVDFAHTAFGETTPLPVYLDDEGTLARDAVLIKDGILTGYMHSRESAQRFGMEPDGNARAWAFDDEPLIRMRNTCILPGSNTHEELIASIDDGYYLIDSSNGQADLTGEFMFGVSLGYEIKNGRIGRALLDTTVSGIAFEMLKTVDMVSDEVVWVSSGMCGKKQPMPVGMGGPALRCRINIGGR